MTCISKSGILLLLLICLLVFKDQTHAFQQVNSRTSRFTTRRMHKEQTALPHRMNRRIERYRGNQLDMGIPGLGSIDTFLLTRPYLSAFIGKHIWHYLYEGAKVIMLRFE